MSEQPVQFRPRRVRWIAVSCAVVLVAAFTVVAVLLQRSDTGVNFRISDQVAIGLVGLLLALAVLLLARPRVRADADGVAVRNVFFSREFAWREILFVSFPDGASFARLELPHDEYYSVIAVQAMDRERAVAAVRALRKLHRNAAEAEKAEAERTEAAKVDTGEAEAEEAEVAQGESSGETGTNSG